ncbi:MAG: aldo/keto reductase [Prevotella sp.]|nr:aldo/keto reductase [Prevotella sp.]
MEDNKNNNISRREFLTRLGVSSASAVGLTVLNPYKAFASDSAPERLQPKSPLPPDPGKMTYRTTPNTGDEVSLMGFGMMRLPRNGRNIDQELTNKLVDYAIEHGINYFDTAPAYGDSEVATGIALKRHPREKFYIATKMSNQHGGTSLEEGKAMYKRSLERLQVDYIDYYLLHSIGQNGMKDFNPRFIDNGLLDFLVEERKAGRIRNLGFSYHGNVEVFDWLLDHDDEYNWDFCQIEMNYIDWRHASLESSGWKHDADAEYLYNKLSKLDIPAVIMEPLLGGRLAGLPEEISLQLKQVRPNATDAQWAFRWVGSKPNVLTVLSGMNRMDHLQENIANYSPLDPCTEEENALLESIADQMSGYPTIPCTACAYCMPCPYGVDIPGNFAYYNQAVNTKELPLPEKTAPDYAKRAKNFAKGYKKALPKKAWATRCIDCENCLSKCPQQIRIPNQMSRITELIAKK